MIHSPIDILNKCNYYIKYDYANSIGTVTVSLLEHNKTTFEWDKDSLLLSISDEKAGNYQIECPPYVAPLLCYTILYNLCDYYKYPYYLVQFYHNGIRTNSFVYEIIDQNDDINLKKFEYLSIIVEDLLVEGLWPDHIELAQENEINDGLSIILSYLYGTEFNI